MNENGFTLIITGIGAFAITIYFLCTIDSISKQKSLIQTQAVEKGYAEYVVASPQSLPVWQWKK